MKDFPFYVTGGTLPPDAPSYVERHADGDLYATLLAGETCYVLNSRQMGKSSLCVRTLTISIVATYIVVALAFCTLSRADNFLSVLSVAFLPDSRRIVIGGGNSTAKLGNITTGQELLTLAAGPGDAIGSVAFAPGGGQTGVGSRSRPARAWDAKTGQETLALIGHSRLVSSVVFSPGGQRILTGSGDGTARVWLSDATAGRRSAGSH